MLKQSGNNLALELGDVVPILRHYPLLLSSVTENVIESSYHWREYQRLIVDIKAMKLLLAS